MLNSQLEKSSIKSLLHAKGMQQATGRVRSKNLLEEMSLVGFVPYSVFFDSLYYDTGLDLNDHLFVTPHLLRSSKETFPRPIFKTIADTIEKKYIIDDKLLIDSIIDIIPDYIFKKERYKECKQRFRGSQLKTLFSQNHSILKEWEEKGVIEISEGDSYNYIARVNEWELSGGFGNIKCISNDFLCLCTYMNKVTGLPSYTLLPSDNTIRVLSETDDE